MRADCVYVREPLIGHENDSWAERSLKRLTRLSRGHELERTGIVRNTDPKQFALRSLWKARRQRIAGTVKEAYRAAFDVVDIELAPSLRLIRDNFERAVFVIGKEHVGKYSA